MPDITREDAAAILSEQKVSEIVDVATVDSVVLNTFETVPMSKKVLRQPMVSALPDAHFVGESNFDDAQDTDGAAEGVKPTTGMKWTDATMTAEEIAVIVPIHENTLDDADIDIWAAVRPKVAEAFALRLDKAVLFGDEAPASWTHANLVAKAIAAGNTVAQGRTDKDLADDFNDLFALVEDDDFDVTDVFSVKSLRSKFRGLRDANGQPIYLDGVRGDGSTATIYGETLRYLSKRLARPTVAQAIALDRNQYQVGIREDFTVKFLDQATVGGVNLAERDMVALRFKFRVAFGSFISPLETANGEHPVAVLTQPAAG